MTNQLKGFQEAAVAEMARHALELYDRTKHQVIVLDAPTGCGKTTMLAELARRALSKKTVIFLTPGKGDLKGQAIRSIGKQLGASTPVQEIDATLILGPRQAGVFVGSYETLVMRNQKTDEYKNKLTRSADKNEARTFWSWLGTPAAPEVVFFIDEAHYGKGTENGSIRKFIADMAKVLGYSPLTIEASATPLYVYDKSDSLAETRIVTVDPGQAIDAQLLRKGYVVNNDKLNRTRAEILPLIRANATAVPLLISAGIMQLDEIDAGYSAENEKSRAIAGIVVADGPEGDAMIEAAKSHLAEAHDMTVDNGQVMVYTSQTKTASLNSLNDPLCPVRVIIYKVALATGWDCPRAQVVIGFRMTKSTVLAKQNRGRYLRTVGAKHYANDMLNYMYVYSNEDVFTKGLHSGKNTPGVEQLVELVPQRDVTSFRAPAAGRTRGNQKSLTALEARKLYAEASNGFASRLDSSIALERNVSLMTGTITEKSLDAQDETALTMSDIVLASPPLTRLFYERVQDAFLLNDGAYKGRNFGNNAALAEIIGQAITDGLSYDPYIRSAFASSGLKMTRAEYVLALVAPSILRTSQKDRNEANGALLKQLVRDMLALPDAPRSVEEESGDIAPKDVYKMKYSGMFSLDASRMVLPLAERKIAPGQVSSFFYRPSKVSEGESFSYYPATLSGPEERFEESFLRPALNHRRILWREKNLDSERGFSVAGIVGDELVICRPDYIGVAKNTHGEWEFAIEVKDGKPTTSDLKKSKAVKGYHDYTGVFAVAVFEKHGKGNGWYCIETGEELGEMMSRFVPRPLPEGLDVPFSSTGHAASPYVAHFGG